MPNSPLIIAELSGNHGGSLDKALRMVDQSADAGADMVKIQATMSSQNWCERIT